MRLTAIALLSALAACNSILGIKDLSGGDQTGDAGTDGQGVDGTGAAVASVRFLLVTPNIFDIDPDGEVTVTIPGNSDAMVARYGVLTTYVPLPLGLDTLEVRANDGLTVVTLPVVYDREPAAGESVTAVVAGALGAADATGARILAVNEADILSTPDPQARIVSALADQEQALSYVLSFPGEDRPPEPLARFSIGVPDPLVPSVSFRLRVGAAVDPNTPGTEEVSLTAPPVAPNSRLIFVLGGNYRTGDQTRDPGLSLWTIQASGSAARVRADPAFLVVNFYADYAGATIWITDANNDALRFSANSDARETPMRVFVPPNDEANLKVDGLPLPHNFMLPGLLPGTRGFVALTGYINPVSPQPGPGDVQIAQPADSSTASFTNVAFVHASPDPAMIDLSFTDLEDQSSLPFATNLGFRGAAERQVRTSPNVEYRIFPPGGSTAISRFTGAETFGRRQITVLSGAVGGTESLRVTDIDLRVWPWQVGAPTIGQ